MPRPLKLYLLAYNSLQAVGWSIALFKVLSGVISTKSLNGAYTRAGDLICFLQILAFLEVLHGAFGLVPSGVLLPFMQWGGRTHWLLAVLHKIVEVQELPAVFITFFAWSLSEIIRYLQYALTCAGVCPYWVTYLRYTAFIVLYPVGVFLGEMWLMYQALPFIKKRSLYSDFFYRLPFDYFYFVTGLLVIYPFLWLKLYLHLFKQRRSKLRKLQEKKE